MLGQGQKPSWSTASCQSPLDRTQKIRPFFVAEQDPILFLQSILGDDTVSPSSSRFLRRIASPRKLHGLCVASQNPPSKIMKNLVGPDKQGMIE
jgi:hypothetical protein